jgi:hypothetical protein
MKKEENSYLVIEDNTFESINGDIVDFAFSSGVVEYLNITGIGKPEKGSKVSRFHSILRQINESSKNDTDPK